MMFAYKPYRCMWMGSHWASPGHSSSSGLGVGQYICCHLTWRAIPRRCASGRNGWIVHNYWQHKNRIYFLSLVDRQARWFLRWKVVWECAKPAIQNMVDEAPKSKWYYNDALDAYDRQLYFIKWVDYQGHSIGSVRGINNWIGNLDIVFTDS